MIETDCKWVKMAEYQSKWMESRQKSGGTPLKLLVQRFCMEGGVQKHLRQLTLDLGVQSSIFFKSKLFFFLGFGPPKIAEKLPEVASNFLKLPDEGLTSPEITWKGPKQIAWKGPNSSEKGPNALHEKGWAFAHLIWDSVGQPEGPNQGHPQKCPRECSQECSQKSGFSQECSRECSQGCSSYCPPQRELLESTLGSTPESTPISESTPESTLGGVLGVSLIWALWLADGISTPHWLPPQPRLNSQPQVATKVWGAKNFHHSIFQRIGESLLALHSKEA